MDVWISSGTHVDSIAEREERIEERFESPDIVFAEGTEKSTERDQIISILRIIPIVPLLAAAVIVHIYILIEIRGRINSKISGGDTGRDVEIVRTLTSRHNIESHEIDNEPLGKYIHNNNLKWGILDWGTLFGITVLLWPSPLTVWNTIQYVVVLLLTGFIFFIALLGVANHAREEKMAQEITNMIEKKYDRAVVVLGEAHHPGVGRRLRNESEFNVLNPKPEDLDWRTRIILRIFEQYDRLKR